jgi:hypothetical protein
MNASRIQNLLFSLAVGVILGVTAWSVAARAPAGAGGGALERAEVATQGSAAKAAEEAAKPTPSDSRVEQKIKDGELSSHPAMYYKKENE